MSDPFERFKQRLATGEILLGDGAWGTQMQKAGLQLGDCPEEWNLSRPDVITGIAREYFQAGADFCLTNTFGGNRYRLVRHGMADRMREINVAGARLSLSAANELNKVVLASIGPTGEYLEPEGMLKSTEMLSAFREQMQALREGGVQGVCIETMYVLNEAVLAVQAARELDLFCMVSMTYDKTPSGFQTMMGTSVAEATRALDRAGADVLGTNCGNGMAEIVAVVREMRGLTTRPLLVKPNAGLPRMVAPASAPASVPASPVYDETPEKMAAHIGALRSAGVSIIGGCCGTTPEHIRAFRAALE
ncbi:MAG TPA: homocysteine S-methyltransferase family protein [Planctomycetota bacterium]|jgi:5-methyltetrahydrofolate--homocysteine methyltransferase